MTDFNHQHGPKAGPGRGKVLVAVAAVVVLAGAGLWLFLKDPGSAPPVPALTQTSPDTPAQASTVEEAMSPEDLQQLTPEKVTTQQQQAMAAVTETVGSAPLEAPLTQRPAFVSPVEWAVFRNVAGQHPDPEQELVNLVNRLRFHKQKERWQELEGAGQDDHRAALAEKLLEELPWHLEHQVLDRSGAHRLQLEILQQHITDPRERNRRAAREAQRIGVTFDIGNS
ncbi:MAG: hypothetical protein EA349_08135 [Halomonadaceae bacterium]|nr:MAG: hypothetical protein EA349_08135 [Halomonadaceae bacterium]